MIFFDRETFYDMANANPNTIQDKVLIDYQDLRPRARTAHTWRGRRAHRSRCAPYARSRPNRWLPLDNPVQTLDIQESRLTTWPPML